MRRRSKGQSLVEMALMLPLLMLVLFGIIDLAYYVYGYGTIYMAARNGTEKAANLAPYKSELSPLDSSDPCVGAILDEIEHGAVLFPDVRNYVQITYPDSSGGANGKRELGAPIQVLITYNIRPLTPLFQFVSFGNRGVMPVQIAARRSVENLGSGPPSVDHPNGIVCDGQ
jgi:TadE-like protein